MKTILKIAVFATCVVVMFLLELQLAPEAQAVLGVRRRTAVRTAVVVGSAYSVQTAQAQQQAAAAQAAAAQAQAEAEAAKQQAAAAQAAASGALPIGTVVSALPAGCSTRPIGGVEYYDCGVNYYRAAFQGSQLVYVTAQP